MGELKTGRPKVLVVGTVLAFTFAAAAIGIVYGVYAGLHDAPPTGTIIATKTFIERRLGLPRVWQRETSLHFEAPCPADPFVILTGGQSNAANALSDPVDASVHVVRVALLRPRRPTPRR